MWGSESYSFESFFFELVDALEELDEGRGILLVVDAGVVEKFALAVDR